MAKVYEVVFDYDHFQQLVPEDQAIWHTHQLVLDGSPKANWVPHVVRVYEPQLVEGDFFGFCPGGIVLGQHAQDVLLDIAEQAGQLLPLMFPSRALALLNVTVCVDCLDHDATEWVYGRSTGRPIRAKRLVFVPGLLPGSSLFKMPRFKKGRLFASEGLQAPEDEFIGITQSSGLTGLRFDLLWEG